MAKPLWTRGSKRGQGTARLDLMAIKQTCRHYLIEAYCACDAAYTTMAGNNDCGCMAHMQWVLQSCHVATVQLLPCIPGCPVSYLTESPGQTSSSPLQLQQQQQHHHHVMCDFTHASQLSVFCQTDVRPHNPLLLTVNSTSPNCARECQPMVRWVYQCLATTHMLSSLHS